MEKLELQATEQTFRYIIEGFAKNSDTANMEKYLEMMKERNMQPGQFPLNPFLVIYARKKDLDTSMKYPPSFHLL
jgi:pentatricopeptide repeat protein